MSSDRQALGISGHRLVPASKEADSVTLWTCLDCGAEFACASRSLESECAPTLESARDA